MPGPKATEIKLSTEETEALNKLIRRHSTRQQIALRARLVLAAADGVSNSQIARDELVDLKTVRLWRARWLGLQAVPLSELSAGCFPPKIVPF